MRRKQWFLAISMLVVLLFSLIIYYFLFRSPLEFFTYSDLNVKGIEEKDYTTVVKSHSECFDPDKRKYLNQYLREVKYPQTSSPFAQMLKERVDKYIEKSQLEKLKSFRMTENITLVKKDESIIGLYNCRLDNEVTDGSIMIFNVCVIKKERGYGYGKQIMKHAIERCQENGKDLTLTVYRDNKSAIDMYKKLGFQIVPISKQPKDDFFMYEKHLMKLQ